MATNSEHNCLYAKDGKTTLPLVTDEPGKRANCAVCGKPWVIKMCGGFVAWRPDDSTPTATDAEILEAVRQHLEDRCQNLRGSTLGEILDLDTPSSRAEMETYDRAIFLLQSATVTITPKEA